MSLFQRHILKEVLAHFLLTAVSLSFLVLVGAAVSASHKTQGAGGGAILVLLPWLAAGALPYLLPLSLLVATVQTYGRLSASGEWTAMRTSGLSATALVLPAVLVALGVGVVDRWILDDFEPGLKARTHEIRRQLGVQALSGAHAGVTAVGLGSFFMTWESRAPDGVFQQPLIVVSGADVDPQDRMRVSARSASVGWDETGAVIRMERAVMAGSGGWLEAADFTARIPYETLTGGGAPSARRPKDAPTRELLTRIAADWPGDKAAWWHEIHRRWALAAAGLPFALLGVGMGVWLRRGNRMAAMASAFGVVLLVFLPLTFTEKGLARSGVLPPAGAAWLPDAVTAVLGAAALRRGLVR